MKLKSITYFVMLGASFNLLWTSNAHAYLDPGTGSLLLQGLLAALAATAVVVKIYWQRVLRFFGSRKSKINAEYPISQVDQKNSKVDKDE